VLVVFVLAFSLIAYRLVAIQAFGHNRGYQHVNDAHLRTTYPSGLRGSILASNGDELALSEMRPTIFADPDEITNPAVEAGRLASILKMSAFRLAADLTEKTTYVAILTDATQAEGTAVTAAALPGIGVTPESIRYYPDGSLASPIVGQLNAAGAGITGLEQNDNSILHGKDGRLVEEVDPSGQPIAGAVEQDIPAKNGLDILTTINPALQYQTEQVLSSAITKAGAKDGVIMVEDTKTGKILAAANMVASAKGPVQAPRALAFTQTYDPGSVGKIITVSAGLARRKITSRTEIPIPDVYDVAGTAFTDDQYDGPYLKPMGILSRSSDIGAIRVAQRLGPDEMYRYLQKYGFTQLTDIAFPGESPGLVPPPSQWSGTSLPTFAFGDGYNVTAAQMISAVNAVANGGVYVPPRLVTATVGADGREHLVATPRSHRVIPAYVAREMTPMLEQVVTQGTGTTAQIPGYAVAGKTGTADQYKDGTIVHGRYFSSFAGYAPAEDPALTVLVVIDNTAGYGAQAAAPAWQAVMKDALFDLAIPSDGTQPVADPNALPLQTKS
jgi:cell division protein FtsI (penicillin-binding protein 3)